MTKQDLELLLKREQEKNRILKLIPPPRYGGVEEKKAYWDKKILATII